MESALISLLVFIVVGAVILGLIVWLIDMLPIDARFKQFVRVALIAIAVILLVFKLLPFLGVSTSL